MLEMDEYSRKTFEDPDTVHKKFDLAVVMEKFRESMRQQFPNVRDTFRRVDSDHDGVITYAEFKQALAKYGFGQLSEDEIIIIMRHFDGRKDGQISYNEGQISYNEFCDAILDEDFTQEMLKTKPHLQQDIDPVYKERVKAKSADREETSQVRRAVREVGDAVYQRRNVIGRLYKELEKMTHEAFVTNLQIKKALEAQGITFKLEDIDRVILYVYPQGDLKRIQYVEFFTTLLASHHDLSMAR